MCRFSTLGELRAHRHQSMSSAYRDHKVSMGATYRRSASLMCVCPVWSSTPARNAPGEAASSRSRSHADLRSIHSSQRNVHSDDSLSFILPSVNQTLCRS